MSRWRLQLLGHPQFFDPRGARVEITSRKTTALVALLATADNGIRSRVWLQQKLWGSREARQAQSSLRRELSSLRKSAPGFPLITTYRTIAVDLTQLEIDIAQAGAIDPRKEFLEGLDIPGEEDFEEWLREMRSHFRTESGETVRPWNASPPALDAQQLVQRPHITIHPIGIEGAAAVIPTAVKAFVREIGAGLVARRWFEVRFETGANLDATGGYSNQPEPGGYDLRSTLLAEESGSVLVLQLTDRLTGKIVGTERRDFGTPKAAEEVHDVVSQVVNLLIEMIASREVRIALARSGKEDSLEGLLWESRRHGGQFTPKRWLSGREMLTRAESHHEVLAERIRMDLFIRLKMEADIGDLEDLHSACKDLAQMDWSDPRGPLFLSAVTFLDRQVEETREMIGHAYKLDPHNPVTVGMVGVAEMAAGDWEAGAHWLDRARRKVRMDRSRAVNLGYAALCDLQLGRPGQAAERARSANTLAPEWPLPLAVLIAAARECGDTRGRNVPDQPIALPDEKSARLLQHLSLFGDDVARRIYKPLVELGLVPERRRATPAAQPLVGNDKRAMLK